MSLKIIIKKSNLFLNVSQKTIELLQGGFKHFYQKSAK